MSGFVTWSWRKRSVVFILVLIAAGLLAAAIRFSLTEEREVTFNSNNLQLAGTLLLPPGASDAPGVVLVHGSGPTTRRSMLLYARIFALSGYVALVYDKRGVGESEGPRDAWRYFNIQELADDASAGHRMLQSHPEVDASNVGYFATSQGAWVAARAATSGPSPAFLVMVSASISTIAEDRLFGMRALLDYKGFAPESVEHAVNLLRADQLVSLRASGYPELAEAFIRSRDEPWFRTGFDTGLTLAQHNLRRLWEKSILEYDPRPELLRVRCPVLWVFGDPAFDRFAPVAQSIAWVKEHDGKSGAHSLVVFNNTDHNLNRVDTGAVMSLLTVRIPVIWKILGWLGSTTGVD